MRLDICYFTTNIYRHNKFVIADHVDDIICHMFQYLNLLKKEGPQEWVHNECRDLDAMKFRFKDKERPASLCTRTANVLHVSVIL